jgi:hypothetical protein
MNPERGVRVTEIVRNQQGEFVLEDLDRNLDLGGSHSAEAAKVESALNPLLQELKDSADKLYVLHWHGTRIPRGAQISGKEIGWTQHGIVKSTEGEIIGYYDRLVDCGGDDGSEQQLIVYTYLK